MKQIIADRVSIIPLGRQGEHLASQIVFDLRAWETLYGSGTAELLHQRPGDDMPYPVPLSRDGSWALWNVTDADTAQSGLGRCELRYRADDTLVKSRIWKTHINGAMGKAAGEAPEPEQSWVNRVLEAGTAAEAAADRAEAAAVHAPTLSESDTWLVWDPELGKYVDTGVYSGGNAPTIDPETKHWIVGGVDTGVSAVGEKGEPGTSGLLPLVAQVILTEDAASIEIDSDLNGDLLNLTEMVVSLRCYGGTNNGVGTSNRSEVLFYLNKTNTALGRTNIGTSIGSAGQVLKNVIYLRKLDWGHLCIWRNAYNGDAILDHRFIQAREEDQEAEKKTGFSAITLYPAADGKTFGAGTRISIYGR